MEKIENNLELRSALVFGATGLVGCALIELLANDDRYSAVTAANRKEVNYESSKITNKQIDFEALNSCQELFKVNDVFICLGTTIKKAGSKEVFEKVDLEYPSKIAELSKIGTAESLTFISSIGADSKSSAFYTRTKGKAEEEIFGKGPEYSYVLRPSMLLGNRNETRIGESIGKFLIQTLGFLLVGKFEKYKGIWAKEVAQSMIFIANSKPKKRTFESDELKSIAINF